MADLKEGDLVYYWDGERPKYPNIGYFVKQLKDRKFSIKTSSRLEVSDGTKANIERPCCVAPTPNAYSCSACSP